MRTINSNYLSTRAVAEIIGVCPRTINKWYRWWENPLFYKPDNLYLPPYYYRDLRKSKYFRKDDVGHLKRFFSEIHGDHFGAMADYTAAMAGERGKKRLERRGMSQEELICDIIEGGKKKNDKKKC